MRKRLSLQSGEGDSQINISPLIDMMFLLLIFFIVSSAFVEETGIEVQKPKASSATNLDKNSILLAITKDGDVIYGGSSIGLSGVRSHVSRLLKNENRPVILMADKSTLSGVLVDVIDECKLAGAKTVSIASEREL